jgi:hypothetical protein
VLLGALKKNHQQLKCETNKSQKGPYESDRIFEFLCLKNMKQALHFKSFKLEKVSETQYKCLFDCFWVVSRPINQNISPKMPLADV